MRPLKFRRIRSTTAAALHHAFSSPVPCRLKPTASGEALALKVEQRAEEEEALVQVDTSTSGPSPRRVLPGGYGTTGLSRSGMDDGGSSGADAAGQAAPLMGAYESPTLFSLRTGRGAAASAAAAASPFVAATTGIDRVQFVDALKKNRDRIRHCRTVPFSVLTYAMYIIALCVHVQISLQYDFESRLLAIVPVPVTADTWYGYMLNRFIPDILPQDPANPSSWGRLNGNNFMLGNYLIIGGVRLITQRRAVGACPLPAGPISELYSSVCQQEGVYSLSEFGDAAAAAAAGVSSAFVPTTVEADPAGERFQLTLDPRLNRTQLEGLIEGLRSAGWIDNRTASIDVQFAVMNGEAGLLGRAAVHIGYSIGGAPTITSSTTSIPVDPYFGARAGIAVLDVLLLLYWIYLLAGTLRRVREALFPSLAPQTPWLARIGMLFSYWRLLDIATTVSMIVTFGVWWALLDNMTLVRDSLGGNPLSVEQDVFNAATQYASFKVAAIVTLAALTLRLFKYFAYQQRLAVISEAIKRGFGDAAHFLLLLSVLIVFFGVWGYFMFGAQVSGRAACRVRCKATTQSQCLRDCQLTCASTMTCAWYPHPQSYYWNTPEGAIMATAKMFMYDYDMEAMRMVRSCLRQWPSPPAQK